MLTIAQHEPQ